ncbi:MFS transporter [Leucobacter sp. wl10]|uniref:MFS transporter n=1 Tax=Leucobacter sp. wl10 TaxID=2304677 RepID=UPI0013C2E549|nr:MFS transporter [Leucobacter sp. wl10]
MMLHKAQYLQLVAGLSPLIAVGSMAVLSSALVGRFGCAVVFGAGAAVAAAGMLVFSRVPADGGLPLAIIASAFIGAGIAPMMTLATDVVVGSAPPERPGAASALSETASEFGAAWGIAALGSIGAALYRAQAQGGVPDDIPAEVADVIGSSLGAALGIAEQLPDDDAAHPTALVRQSFIGGRTAR